MAQRDDLIEKIEAKLDALEDKIRDLKMHLTDEVDEAGDDVEAKLEQAEEEKNALAKLLADIRDTADDAWEGVKDRFESMWDAMDDDEEVIA
jgi:chromosome segregation ATPase